MLENASRIEEIIAALNAERKGGDSDGFWTTQQKAEQLRRPVSWVRRAARELAAAGLLEVGSVMVTRLDGCRTSVAAYRVKERPVADGG